MGQTPVYVKLQIVALLPKVNNYCVIVGHLQEEGVKIRRHTVARILKQYRDSGSLAGKTAPGHKPLVPWSCRILSMQKWRKTMKFLVMCCFLTHRPLIQMVGIVSSRIMIPNIKVSLPEILCNLQRNNDHNQTSS